MSTVINTGLLTTKVRGDFFAALKTASPLYTQLCTTVQSTGASESYKWLGMVPTMREWGNGRVAKGLRTESYSIENKKYEATIEVDRDELADDQLGQIRPRVQELAKRAAVYPDNLLANLINYGDTPGYHGYDGVPFFSDSHVSGKSGTQSNILTFNASDPTAPTPAECAALFNDMISAMMLFRDDQGEIMTTDMNGLVLLVHPSRLQPWKNFLGGTLVNSNSNIPIAQAQLVANSRSDNAAEVFLAKTDVSVRPFIFQDREALEFNALEKGSEEEFKREKYLFGVRARYALAYGYWQYCVRGTFT